MYSLRLIFNNQKYFSAAWVFASLNILFGTWAIYIPQVKENLQITEGQLGIALFFFAFGTLVFIPFTSIIIKKLGLGKATIVAIIGYAIAFLLPFMATSYFLLAFSLFIVGATSGFTDVAMNTLVSEIEREDKASFMSASHGFFSLGGVIGAGVGSYLKLFIESPLLHMCYVSLFVLISNIVLVKNYIHIKGTKRREEAMDFKYLKPLLGLSLIGLLIMGSEGAIADWSGLYLKNITMTSSMVLIGLGYTIFSATMTTGRFLGDYIASKFGALKIIIAGALLGAMGYILILTAYTFVALAGFGLVGLGFSVIIPELFRLGGKVEGVETSKGIAFIAGTGYVGFLTGPVLLGFLADIASLKLSFMALLLAAIIVFVIASILRRQ
ncbi:MFS transporter [Galbibacter pacificus]|uniref:MFS transporter n=1 Tax=Galbibacter pacificus TaxID=2996052 RepID=A0ABT6FLZ5_9FLAO|nr:MFS transporter [Galbibacter pacificus]MDG3580802.1 MFS transporter [Galbibacter pacificus]MDG3584280.1 MFS transporter [Galbibacter pacificus]